MALPLTSLSVAPIWLWLSFVGGVLLLLSIDLSLFKRRPAHSSLRFSLIESAAWILISLSFNVFVASHFGSELGVQFLTAYLIEKSLSIDNLFVILLIFASFRISTKHQHRVLFFGVLGAIVMRGLFILIGAHLLHAYHWILYVFGGVLVFTAYRFIADSMSEQIHEARENWAVRFVTKIIPVANHQDGDRFFIVEKGRRLATTLFLALVVIEITDLVFAVDSIPAVFSITSDAFIAFSSNILALLGLRALYFVLAESVSKVRFLKPGLAGVLGFIGLKMLSADYVHISSGLSLIAIAVILTAAVASSVWADRRDAKVRRH